MGRGKTIVLMCILMLMFVYVGNLIGGKDGMKTAFLMACGLNLFSYFFSDKLVLKQYAASEVTPQSAPQLYQIVKRLSERAGLPIPKVYIVPEQAPNAFATGRNPSHAAVAVTQGLLNFMTEEEIEGVLAHEMSHVRHYDILIGSVAAVFAGAIAMLGNMARYQGVSRQDTNKQRSNGLALIISAILLPIAGSIIQMTISRTREYAADEGSARLTGHPEWLISALSKLEGYANNYQMQRASSQTAHLFIVDPFGKLSAITKLFRTHPTTAERIERLKRL